MSHPIRVVMLSTDRHALDASSEVYDRLRKYAREVASLHVLLMGPSGRPVTTENLTIEPVPVSMKLGMPWAVKHAVKRAIKDGAADVVSSQDPFEIGLGAWWAVKGTKVPLHVQVHTDFLSPYFARESWKNRVRQRLARRVLPHAAGIRVVSERIKKSLIAKYGATIKEPTVIPVVVSITSYPPTDLPQHDFVFSLIAVSRLEEEKCVDDILRALALVRKKYPRTGLFIVGDGRQKGHLLSTVHSLGLTDAVQFLGWRTDARALMAAAQAFIQASSYEGYGMTLVEAALARVPIITTDVGIVGEVLRPDLDVLVSPIGAPHVLAEYISRLIEDNQMRITISSEASHTIRNHLAAHMDQPEQIAEDIARAAGSTV